MTSGLLSASASHGKNHFLSGKNTMDLSPRDSLVGWKARILHGRYRIYSGSLFNGRPGNEMPSPITDATYLRVITEKARHWLNETGAARPSDTDREYLE
jgi:hypothetical protein